MKEKLMRISNCKNRTLYAIVVGGLLLTLTAVAVAEVEQVCVDRFMDNDAIPGEESCTFNALTSPAGLSNFACTGPRGEEIVAEYCGLVDDDECDFEPIDAPGGSVLQTNTANSTAVGINAFPQFVAIYGSIFSGFLATSSPDNIAPLFEGIFGFSSSFLLTDDIDSQFSELGDFGGLVDNLEGCP